jgi:Tfp pilus assembly major pilin PilA
MLLMKRLIRNNKGFTLAELVIAGGIVGVIALVAVTSLKNTRQASNITVVASEASTLKSLIVAQLVNPVGCRNTFPANVPITRSNIQIISSGGAIVAQKDLAFGPTKEFSIIDISSSSAVGSNILKLKVDYDLKASLDKVSKKRSYSFDIDIFVNKNAAGTVITGCYIDIAGSTRKAIENSCVGNGAAYVAADGLYGTCTHTLPEVRNSSGIVMGTGLCPSGEYLKNVTSESSPNKVVLECRPFAVGPCGPWSYINKVNGTTGVADCVSLSTYFAPGRVITTINSNTPTYLAVDLNCTHPDQVVRSINADGTPECIPKHIETICPANQYVYDVVKISSTVFEGKCKAFEKKTAGPCPAGQYLQTVYSDGSVPVGGCVVQTIPANCPVGQVITGFNSDGTAKCVVNN